MICYLTQSQRLEILVVRSVLDAESHLSWGRLEPSRRANSFRRRRNVTARSIGESEYCRNDSEDCHRGGKSNRLHTSDFRVGVRNSRGVGQSQTYRGNT